MGWGTFKPLLADALISALKPIQDRHQELKKDPAELNRVLLEGSSRAEEVAQKTLQRVHAALGMLKRTNQVQF